MEGREGREEIEFYVDPIYFGEKIVDSIRPSLELLPNGQKAFWRAGEGQCMCKTNTIWPQF